MSKSKFYRRVRNAIMGVTGKSCDRVITDTTMFSPLANDKGTTLSDKGNFYKRSLKQSRDIQYRRTGTRNK